VSLVKCVVWDLDDTVWPGVAIESDETPRPHQHVLALLAELEGRGIVSSVASRGDPSVAAALLDRFVEPQVSWDPKAAAIQRIAGALGIGLDAVAFVDEDPFERAEVAHLVPEVRVLSVAELRAALGEPAFTPAQITDEGRRRVSLYRDEDRRRRAESGFAGRREDFLRSCDMRLEIRPAAPAELDRLGELGERTHRLNSTASRHGRDEMRRWLDRGQLTRARLADRFGEYGLIGLAAVERPPAHAGRELALLAVSCRVDGRGVPAALLRWTMDEARRAGAREMRVRYRPNGRNVRLAVLLRQLGFQHAAGEFRRSLEDELPPYPDWLRIE
jgi:FkbH-like protein